MTEARCKYCGTKKKNIRTDSPKAMACSNNPQGNSYGNHVWEYREPKVNENE